MVSKYFEILPIFLTDISKDMSYGKFKPYEYLRRETEIMALLECNIDPPNHYEFALLYFKLIRLFVQALNGPIQKTGLNYILQAESFTHEFCKMILADITMMSVRPSIVAAAGVVFGLNSAVKHIRENPLPLPPKLTEEKAAKELEKEMDLCDKAWREIVKELLRDIEYGVV